MVHGFQPVLPQPPIQDIQPVAAQRLTPQTQAAPIFPTQTGQAVRIKDITTIEGHRANRVTGFGLVTGLKGTGGSSQLTQSFGQNMLRNFDILADAVPTGSLAAVVVTAEVPPFKRPGETISATVSIYDDTTSLYGGELQTTTLRGLDGKVYAVAGGALIVGGFSAEGAGGGVSKNHDTAAKVNGQIEVPMQTGHPFPGNSFRLLLKNKDYATANRIATEINRYYPRHARALDVGRVEVFFPSSYDENSRLGFLETINLLRVVPDVPARVVINQKTGTIVVGQNVRLSKIVFANDNLIITTSETPVVSQPAPFSDGETVVLPRTQVTATETGGTFNTINQQTTVGELASTLNALGVSPQDLIGIFQSIEAEGGLQAQLIIQ